MTAKAEPAPGTPAAVSSDADFLFHLYRGSELLLENRLVEAQGELEHALSLEPTDARTQGLLGGVYFRAGLYARAAATYRQLLRDRPTDPTLRLNLALCFLKTGEPQAARVELESLVLDNIGDRRAWGYLAVALDRLGYVDQAREAFERAGEPDLARRMVERGARTPRTGRLTDATARRRIAGAPARPAAETGRPRVDDEEAAEATRRGTGVRHASFDSLDAGQLHVDLMRAPAWAEAGPPSAPGTATAASDALQHVSANPRSPPSSVATIAPHRLDTKTLALGAREARGFATAAPRSWAEAPPLASFLEDARFERRSDRSGEIGGVTVLGSKLVRVDLDAESDLGPAPANAGFAFRLESLRSFIGALDPDILPRQVRTDPTAANEVAPEKAGETFGGIGTPFGSMKGPGQLIIGPRPGFQVHAFVLRDEVVFFREDAVVGFDLSLRYENGRLGLGGWGGWSDPSARVVQLRGAGTLLLELATELLALDVLDAKGGGLTVRKEVVVGWVGRLLPRLLDVGEAPCGQRGLLGFSGEGTVLVSAK